MESAEEHAADGTEAGAAEGMEEGVAAPVTERAAKAPGRPTFLYDVLMRLFTAGLLLAQCAALWAQAPPLPPIRDLLFPQQVKQYVGLTDEQVARIVRLNAGLAQFQALKAARQIQVRIEIAQETRRDALDATALGLRYLELEVIRREVEAEQRKVVAAVQALLTEPQKTKVAALRQVLADYGTACAAVAANVVPAPDPQGVTAVRVSTDPFTTITGAILGSLPTSCGTAMPAAVIRTGEFQAEP